jgi:uncharacterized membrane-anchored protein
MTANLGGIAEIQVPAGYLFIGDKSEIRKFNDMTQNLTSAGEVGVLMPETKEWFVVFEFSDIGYVEDSEKDELDADAILASIRESTEKANAEKRRRGWPTLHVVGWDQEPHYDSQTNLLIWATRLQSAGSLVVNHQSRILGRRGVMSAILVVDPEHLPQTLPVYNSLLSNFTFKPGQKYSEWQPGDKVAAYGLTGLILGGGTVALAKSGWLGKFWKLIVGGVVAVGAAISAFFKKLFGRQSAAQADS